MLSVELTQPVKSAVKYIYVLIYNDQDCCLGCVKLK